ncbi:hypothetical protein BDN71DRAFT_1429537 [Pleurotus eryngii]|uniref:Uncharacterized protein n=1 Tax=Pleurotus eryngii TaxID=5323 RepID=A0A9P6A205_PLEER|nr:hypothetical protein BDN71DRAFT_1429537 [Pleurotus eryngii]
MEKVEGGVGCGEIVGQVMEDEGENVRGDGLKTLWARAAFGRQACENAAGAGAGVGARIGTETEVAAVESDKLEEREEQRKWKRELSRDLASESDEEEKAESGDAERSSNEDMEGTGNWPRMGVIQVGAATSFLLEKLLGEHLFIHYSWGRDGGEQGEGGGHCRQGEADGCEGEAAAAGATEGLDGDLGGGKGGEEASALRMSRRWMMEVVGYWRMRGQVFAWAKMFVEVDWRERRVVPSNEEEWSKQGGCMRFLRLVRDTMGRLGPDVETMHAQGGGEFPTSKAKAQMRQWGAGEKWGKDRSLRLERGRVGTAVGIQERVQGRRVNRGSWGDLWQHQGAE